MKSALTFLFILAAYFFSGKLGLEISSVSGFVTVVWPPTGIAIASLLIFGLSYWPAVSLGALFVNLDAGAPVALASAIMVGNTFEAIFCPWLLRKLGFELRFEKLRDVFNFLSAVAIAAAIAASGGALALALNSQIAAGQSGLTWWWWWLGDFMGALLLTPLCLVWFCKRETSRLQFLKQNAKKFAVFAFLFILLCILIFSEVTGPEITRQFKPYFIFPFMMWAALSLGQRGVTVAMLLTSIASVWSLSLGHGLPSFGSLNDQLFFLQTFMLLVSVTGLSLAALVAERNRAEQEILDRVEELKRSNSELEQFASIASHDLREPLRTITLYIDLLKKELKNPSEDTAEYLNFVYESAHRMNALVESIMKYSRAGKRDFEFKNVDCLAEVRKILELLRDDIQASGAKIQLDTLPTLEGESVLLGEVFYNLISNAIKYRRKDVPLQVHIGVEDQGFQWLFFVKDNGMGFSMKHATKVFQLFQRLGSGDLHSGAGIGLAFAKKIVSRHGGDIWVRSEEGQGSIFYFTIPKPDTSPIRMGMR